MSLDPNPPARFTPQKRSCRLGPWLRLAGWMLIASVCIRAIFALYAGRLHGHHAALLSATESGLITAMVAGAFLAMLAGGAMSIVAFCLRTLRGPSSTRWLPDRRALAPSASSSLLETQRRSASAWRDVPSAPAGWGGNESRWRFETIRARRDSTDVLDRRLGMCVWWTPAPTRRTTTTLSLSISKLTGFASDRSFVKRVEGVHQPQSQPSMITILNPGHASEKHPGIPWQARTRILTVGGHALPFPIPLDALLFFGAGVLLAHAISLPFGSPGPALMFEGGLAAAVAGCVLLRGRSDRRWRTIIVPARDPVAAGRVATLAHAHALASRLAAHPDAAPDIAVALHAVRWLTWEIAGLQRHAGSDSSLTGLYGQAGALRDRLAALDAEHQRNALAAPVNACARAARAQALEHAQSASEMASLVLHDLSRVETSSLSAEQPDHRL